jgi:hypothetical protein
MSASPDTPDGGAEIGYERRDVDAGRLLRTFFAIVLVTVAVIVLLWWLYHVFVADEAARQPPPPILKPESSVHAPPPPRLQTVPAADLEARREREDALLDGYGWVDREKQRVRIPIAEAMRLLAERGIPPGASGGAPPPPPAKDDGGAR